MNPFASTKWASRVLMALAAISGIVLAAGCGSSNSSTPPNQQGFSNTSLSGTYVFSSQGTDVNGYPIAIAGTFVANGSSSSPAITGGTVDIVDPEFDIAPNTPPSPAAQLVTSGSYSVGADGRGQLSLNITAYGTYIFDFALYSTSSGLISLYDANNGTGSGTLDLQTAPTSISQLAGPYAFTIVGSDGSGNPLAIAGAFSLDQNGNITAGLGTEDFNDNLVVANEALATGTATLGSGNGPGAIPISSSSFPLTFDYYPIDNTHFKLIETDYVDFVAGDAFTQTGFTSVPTSGTSTFSMVGGTSASGPIGNAGSITFSASSIGGTEDVISATNYVPGIAFTGNEGAAGTGGRVVIAMSQFNPAAQLVVYPSSGGLLMLETDADNLTVGAAYPQTAGAGLTTSQGYAFNLSALNFSGGSGSVYEEDDIAQFDATSASAFSGHVDINDEGSLTPNQTWNGTISGTSVTTTTGTGSNPPAFVSFNFYPVTNSQFLVLETDSGQLGTGIFFEQTSPSAAAAAVANRARSAAVVVHPVVRPHVSRQHGSVQAKQK